MSSVVAVGDLALQVRGVTYKKADASKAPGPGRVGIVRAGNIKLGELTLDDLVFVPQQRVSENQMLRAGDVLIAASSGSIDVVGKAARVRSDEDVAFGGFCKVLRPGPSVDAGYFSHYFQTPAYRAHVSRVAAGANINNLKNSHLDDIEIPLPSIQEQRQIAAVLDSAQALQVKRHQSLAKLDTLTQATFVDMFGDPTHNPHGYKRGRLADFIESATYGTSRKAGSMGRFPVLRMGNVTVGGDLDLSDMKFVDLPDHEQPKHLVQAGDVLFNRTNSADLVGKTAVYRLDEPMAFAGYLVRLRPTPDLHPEYLGALMNMPSTKQKLRSMCKSIVGMANINAKEVQTIELPVPSLSDQEQFASRLAGIARHRLDHTGQLERLNELFASLQQRAFRGEL